MTFFGRILVSLAVWRYPITIGVYILCFVGFWILMHGRFIEPDLMARMGFYAELVGLNAPDSTKALESEVTRLEHKYRLVYPAEAKTNLLVNIHHLLIANPDILEAKNALLPLLLRYQDATPRPNSKHAFHREGVRARVNQYKTMSLEEERKGALAFRRHIQARFDVARADDVKFVSWPISLYLEPASVIRFYDYKRSELNWMIMHLLAALCMLTGLTIRRRLGHYTIRELRRSALHGTALPSRPGLWRTDDSLVGANRWAALVPCTLILLLWWVESRPRHEHFWEVYLNYPLMTIAGGVGGCMLIVIYELACTKFLIRHENLTREELLDRLRGLVVPYEAFILGMVCIFVYSGLELSQTFPERAMYQMLFSAAVIVACAYGLFRVYRSARLMFCKESKESTELVLLTEEPVSILKPDWDRGLADAALSTGLSAVGLLK